LRRLMMNQVQYIRSLFAREDEVLRSIAGGLAARGMPQISVPPETGKTLYLLAKMCEARDILEIGALGGYSTIWLARALPREGRLLSLELREEHAAYARENVNRAGVGEQVEIRIGDAMELLTALEEEGASFDFLFKVHGLLGKVDPLIPSRCAYYRRQCPSGRKGL
jgi:caffeoyl-CoA O-methyltransferase